jgi:cobalt ECF transporter T component CbiQ
MTSEEIARRPGLMQLLDARVRVAGVFALVVAVALAHKLQIVIALWILASLLALASRIPLRTLALRVWLVVLAFTGVIALPALFLTPGDPLIASGAITQQGLHSAAMLVARVEAAVTLTTLLVLSTPWAQILKALRSLCVPKEAVMMLGMAHRYIFLLAEAATQMFESRQSRTVGVLAGPQRRRLTSQSAGVLLSKSIDLSQEVFLAMQSRGYRGDVHIVSESRMRTQDWGALLAFMIVAAMTIWLGR